MPITAEFQRIQTFTGQIQPRDFFKLATYAETLSYLTIEELKIIIGEINMELNLRECNDPTIIV